MFAMKVDLPWALHFQASAQADFLDHTHWSDRTLQADSTASRSSLLESGFLKGLAQPDGTVTSPPLTFLPCRVSSSGKHHRRLSSSLDGTMRRLRLSDDASSSPSSADLEPGLPRPPLTDRPSSRLASTSQAGPYYHNAIDVTRVCPA